ncbi:MAG: phosphomethylpyrimidine synthase ThiC [Bacteroidaceae bacterium]|nr:phosphomethylpyrimidine synthase ThiC [Bacteroidaceae bacterium]
MVSKVLLKSCDGFLAVGGDAQVRVNCNVGICSEAGRAYETERLEAIKAGDCKPDTFMDLSIGELNRPFYKEIQQRFNCPVGFVPSYLLPTDRVLKKHQAINIIKRLADDGIAFITLHLTASMELYQQAKTTRRIPVTSRGGSAVLQQMTLTGANNIWQTCLPEILEIVKQYGMAISLGTTFRPAGIADACDKVHLKETEAQLKLCHALQAEGVQVMVENVGHIAIDRLERHCQHLKECNAPIMPLGPLPIDCAIGTDHTAAAVGATFMGYWGCAHIINCITRAEHTNSTFTIEETLEAIRSARVAAHIVDVARGMGHEEDEKVYDQRAKNCNCLASTSQNCTRCDTLCPLKRN